MLTHVGQLPTGWSVRVSDVRDLPLPDDTFDAACASYLLHLLPPADLTPTLAEIRRALRPGGRLVTVTNSHGTGRRRTGGASPIRCVCERQLGDQARLEPVACVKGPRGVGSVVETQCSGR
jgi:SAM-dependent methyltransferase